MEWRYFLQCISRDSPSDALSRFVVSTIDSMYHEERLIQEEHAGDYAKICSLRMERIRLIYDILRTRIEKDGQRYSQKTRIGATIQYYSTFRTALFNGLVPYEYLVYLFDSLPNREDKKFDYGSYIPWADGIRERVKEHITNKFAN